MRVGATCYWGQKTTQEAPADIGRSVRSYWSGGGVGGRPIGATEVLESGGSREGLLAGERGSVLHEWGRWGEVNVLVQRGI